MVGSKIGRMRMRRILVFGLLLVALVAASIIGTKSAGASTTFTVDSTRDAGDNSPGNGSCFTGAFIQVGTRFLQECTLRAAIEEANDNDATVVDEIRFDILASGVQTIYPDKGLPVISESVNIGGYTQPGASENTLVVGHNAVLLIRLDGSDAGLASGLNVATDDSVVRGLSVTRVSPFPGASASPGPTTPG